MSEPHSGNSSVSEPQTHSVTVSEPHTRDVNVSELHTHSVTVSEPHTRNVNVSEPHSGNSTPSSPSPTLALAFSFGIIVLSVGELFQSSAWSHKHGTSSLQRATHHIKGTHPLLIPVATESKKK